MGSVFSTPNATSYRTWGVPSASNTSLILQSATGSGTAARIELSRSGNINYDGATHYFRNQSAVERMQTRARLYELNDYAAYSAFDEGVFDFEVPGAEPR